MDKKAKIIYICAPLKGNILKNTLRARLFAKMVAGIGHVPLTPHLNFYVVFDDQKEHERQTVLLMREHLVARCDELWVFGEREKDSEGMRLEISVAKANDIPVKRVEVI